MRRPSRGALIGGLALAMVATLGGAAVLPDRGDPAATEQAAPSGKNDDSGLLDGLGDAARGLVAGGNRARPEVISAGLHRDEKPVAGRKWPARKRVKELPGRRTENAKIYQLADGRLRPGRPGRRAPGPAGPARRLPAADAGERLRGRTGSGGPRVRP